MSIIKRKDKGQKIQQPAFADLMLLGKPKDSYIERIGPSGAPKVEYQRHIARYLFARRQIPDIEQKDVLDLACGFGYGSNMLASKAKSVTGGDISAIPINLAQLKYTSGIARKARDNLTFAVMDAQNLSFPANSYDAVVSFETLEHVPEPEKMVSEASRVLKPGEPFIISTPNGELARHKDGKPLNPFHVKEYTREEFLGMLKPHFDEIELFGQGILEPDVLYRRQTLSFLRKLDFLRLRRFLPKGIKSSIRLESRVSTEIKPSEDINGQPLFWIAICR